MPDGLLLCRLGIDDHQGQSDFDQLFAVRYCHSSDSLPVAELGRNWVGIATFGQSLGNRPYRRNLLYLCKLYHVNHGGPSRELGLEGVGIGF